MLKIEFNEKYQLFFLKKALNEIIKEKNINKNFIKNIKEDHENGCNYINNVKIPVTFPICLKNFISELNKDKKLKYNYKGTISPTKRWVLKYKSIPNSIIEESRRGRSDKKYEIDINYYQNMCNSCFTLCPTEWGDKKSSWTYRFFEAIMSLSIPILQNNSNDIHMKNYFFYYDSDDHVYSKEKAEKNYNIFINSKHFLNNIELFTKIKNKK